MWGKRLKSQPAESSAFADGATVHPVGEGRRFRWLRLQSLAPIKKRGHLIGGRAFIVAPALHGAGATAVLGEDLRNGGVVEVAGVHDDEGAAVFDGRPVVLRFALIVARTGEG